MENLNNINKENLKEIALELSKIERKNPFEVPQDYFEDFSLKIKNKITVSEPKNTLSWYNFIFRPQYAIAIFIGVILLASGAYYFNKQNQQLADNGNIYWDEVLNDSNNTIIDNFDENTLIEALALATPEEETGKMIKTDSTLNAISTDELNEYINHNNNDVFYEN